MQGKRHFSNATQETKSAGEKIPGKYLYNNLHH